MNYRITYEDVKVMTVGTKMSEVLTKIHVIEYSNTVKARFGTKPHYPPQFETQLHNFISAEEKRN